MKKSFFYKWFFFSFLGLSFVHATDALKFSSHPNSEPHAWERLYGYHARLNEAGFKLDESDAKAISQNPTSGKESLLEDRSVWPFSSKKVQVGTWYDEDRYYRALMGQTDAFGVMDLYGLRLAEAFWGLKAVTANGYSTMDPRHALGDFRNYQCRGTVCGMPSTQVSLKEGERCHLPLVITIFLMGFNDPNQKVALGRGLFTFVASHKMSNPYSEKDKKISGMTTTLLRDRVIDWELRFSENDKKAFLEMERDVTQTVAGCGAGETSVVGPNNLNTNGTGFGGYMQWLMRQKARSVFLAKKKDTSHFLDALIRFKKSLQKGDAVSTFARMDDHDRVRVILFNTKSKEAVAWGQYKKTLLLAITKPNFQSQGRTTNLQSKL